MRRFNFKYIIMEVKIIKCSHPESWYSDLIGEKFEVEKWGSDLVLKEDRVNDFGMWRHIPYEDCQLCE